MARSHRFMTSSCVERATKCVVVAIAAMTCFVFADARAQTLLWKTGTAVGDLDRMGDFDGDGVGDVVINDSGNQTPAVLSGKDGSVLQTYSQKGTWFGWSVAGIGDQDGDGVPDLLFGDPQYSNIHGNRVGRVTGISGATGSTFYSYTGWQISWNYQLNVGICVRGMGDVNGDGLPDFAYGTLNGVGWLVGPSIVTERWNGGATGLDVTLTWDFDNSLYAPPVHGLAPLGDVDGDGASDFAAGYDDLSTGTGTIEVHSGASGNLIRKVRGTTNLEHFAFALGSCPDQDGDGIREIMVGAPTEKVGSIAPGRVLIYSGATAVLLRTLDGEFDQQWFGYDLDGLDDVDGDGVGDFVVASGSANGRVQVFSGATGVELQRIDPESALRVRDVGDLDGDGHDDLAVANGAEAHAWKVAPYLAVDSVTPPRIRYDRVGLLVVNGAGFTADPNLSVLIDGTPATNVVVYSYTVLSCNAPAGILPGPHDVTVTNRFGSATLSDGLLLTPAMFVDGVPTLGSTVYLRYEFDPLDSTFAIFGLPPQQSIPTPPFGGLLGIVPFFPLFTLASYPGDEFVVHANIPNDPALSGVTVLFQSLTGPNFKGSGKDAAWSNVAALAIQ
jgi:IPT/TIG domain-containing protein